MPLHCVAYNDIWAKNLGSVTNNLAEAKDERILPPGTHGERLGRVSAQELNKASFEIISRGTTQIKKEFYGNI
jgi:hypothetical protein